MTNYNNSKEIKQLSNEDLKVIFDNSLFYSHTEVEEQKPCIWINEGDFNTTVASLGNISTIVGKAKAGKTFLISAIASALLTNSTCLNFSGKLPEGKTKVLIIDTEQSKLDCKKVCNRISLLTGCNENEHSENLIFSRLRGIEPKTIVRVVDYIVNQNSEIGAVIIDGIKDLIYSINDEREATETAVNLMGWSETKGIHIFTVLHENKIDNNVRGHIGTELQNKSETVISVRKQEHEKNLFIIEAKFQRDKEFTPFAFQINNNGIPELAEYKNSFNIKKSKSPNDYDEKIHINILKNIFPTNNNCSKREFYQLLKEELKQNSIDIGDNTARTFTNYYIDNDMIINNGTESNSKLIFNEKNEVC